MHELLYTIVDFKSSLELVLYVWFISTLNKALNWIELEVEFESCVHCNYFNDRARKVRKIFPEGCKIKSGIVFRIVLTLSLKSLHSTQESNSTSVNWRVLYEKWSNKWVKILKFWRTELSYAQNKQSGEKERLLGINTCPSLNDVMGIRCIKCNRSEQVYDIKSFGVSCLVDN
jgi:hypothetical protein